jgi:DNA repair exonuclease SbcCD ATPase subunit
LKLKKKVQVLESPGYEVIQDYGDNNLINKLNAKINQQMSQIQAYQIEQAIQANVADEKDKEIIEMKSQIEQLQTETKVIPIDKSQLHQKVVSLTEKLNTLTNQKKVEKEKIIKMVELNEEDRQKLVDKYE